MFVKCYCQSNPLRKAFPMDRYSRPHKNVLISNYIQLNFKYGFTTDKFTSNSCYLAADASDEKTFHKWLILESRKL